MNVDLDGALARSTRDLIQHSTGDVVDGSTSGDAGLDLNKDEDGPRNGQC